MVVTLQLLGLLLLLLLSAFFSGSEAALFSISSLDRRKLVQSGKRNARLLDSLLSQPQRVLVTLLSGNTLVNVGASFFATLLFLRLSQATGLKTSLSMVFAVGLMTFVLLIFGEFTPKIYCLTHAESLSLRFAPLLRPFLLILSPLTWLFDLMARRISSLLTAQPQLITLEELKVMVELCSESGTLNKDEARMIRSIFTFQDTKVKEVMTPRTEMSCLKSGLTISEALQHLREEPHSRVPVYKDTVDNITGIVYAKDLLPHLASREAPIDAYLREPYFVPEQLSSGELLSEFRKRQVHIAIVVDEYGGTSGLATLDDLLEEMVGEIMDEHDFGEEPMYRTVGPGEVTARGRMDLDDLNSLLGTNLPTEQYDTLGGLIYGTLGRIPGEGETLSYGGILFSIEEIKGRRIETVRVKRMEEE